VGLLLSLTQHNFLVKW